MLFLICEFVHCCITRGTNYKQIAAHLLSARQSGRPAGSSWNQVPSLRTQWSAWWPSSVFVPTPSTGPLGTEIEEWSYFIYSFHSTYKSSSIINLTIFFKANSLFLSIPFFHSSRICSLGIRLVRVCASSTESASRLLILSGSERDEIALIVRVYVRCQLL